jgi:cell division transport system permease protein
MRTWLNQHVSAARFAQRRLTATPLNTLLAVLAIGIALALPAGGQMLLANIQHMGQKIGQGTKHYATSSAQISLYLNVGAERSSAEHLAEVLGKHPAVKSVDFIDRETTLQRMRQAAGLKDVIDALPANPFPDALVITPKDDSAEAIEALAAEMRALPKVDHVQLDSTWIKRLDALLKVGRMVVALLGSLLGIGLVAITFNIIRLQVMTMRAEIEVSQLLGATDGYIQRPFLYFGGLLGLLGGLLAWCLVLIATALLRAPVSALSELYGTPLSFASVDPADGLLLLAAATALGWVGAALSLRQYLRAATNG